MKTLLEIDGVSKSFGSVIANENISLTVKEGEILALLGENGAGKSTLVKAVFGLVKPDAGTIKINGTVMESGDTAAAIAEFDQAPGRHSPLHWRNLTPPVFYCVQKFAHD